METQWPSEQEQAWKHAIISLFFMCKLQDNVGWEQMIILPFYLLHWAQTLSVLCPGPEEKLLPISKNDQRQDRCFL